MVVFIVGFGFGGADAGGERDARERGLPTFVKNLLEIGNRVYYLFVAPLTTSFL